MSPTFDPERVDAVTFDSYGTLVDTGAAATVLEGVVDDPAVVAGPLDEHETYMQLHRLGLADALRAAGYDPSPERLREFNAVYHDLAPYDDVAAAVARLDTAGYAPSILSNGNPEMLASLVETTGIEDAVHERISADTVRRLNRGGEEWTAFGGEPAAVVDSLDALCARLLDRRGRPSLGCRASTETQASCVWEYRDVYRGAGATSWRRYWTVP